MDDKPEGDLFDLDERWLDPKVRHRALAYMFGWYVVDGGEKMPPQMAQFVKLHELLTGDVTASGQMEDALLLIRYLRDPETPETEDD